MTALTRSFEDNVRTRTERDPAFRDALLTEAVDQFLAGDFDTGKAILRDCITATIGFDRLAAETGSSFRRLMQMVSPAGNLTASTLFSMPQTVRKAKGGQLAVEFGRKPKRCYDRSDRKKAAPLRGAARSLGRKRPKRAAEPRRHSDPTPHLEILRCTTQFIQSIYPALAQRSRLSQVRMCVTAKGPKSVAGALIRLP